MHLVLAILLVLTVTSANDAIDRRDTGNDGVAYDDQVIEYLYKGARYSMAVVTMNTYYYTPHTMGS